MYTEGYTKGQESMRIRTGEKATQAVIPEFKRLKGSVLRRPRTDSVLENLPDDQHEQLCKWMLTTLSYVQMVERMKNEFGVITSRQALCNFYYNHAADHVIRERTRRRHLSGKVNLDIRRHPAQYDQSAIDSLMSRIDMIARDDEGNIRHLKIYTDAVSRLRTLALAEADINLKLRRLAILERQEKQAKKALKDSKLTPEEQAQHLRDIFQK